MTGRAAFGAAVVLVAIVASAGGAARDAMAQSPPAPSASSSRDAAPNGGATPDKRHLIDAVAVRFYAPETGGPSQPLFVTERTLAFEARLEALQEGYVGNAEPYAERHVRAALEHHIAEEMLARLPFDSTMPAREFARQVHDVGIALVTRIGGNDVLLAAAAAEGISAVEVDAMLRRQARAGLYIDRAISPILHPSDDQLREVFRTAAHPYRGQTFEIARPNLERWFVAERLRVAKSGFLQTARTRVKIIAVPR